MTEGFDLSVKSNWMYFIIMSPISSREFESIEVLLYHCPVDQGVELCMCSHRT
jgi:hypothetical protein